MSEDWIVTPDSNCHICCNQLWFTSSPHVSSTADGFCHFSPNGPSSTPGCGAKTEGMGTVCIPVHVHAKGCQPVVRDLIIPNVWYVPDAPCNILSTSRLAEEPDRWVVEDIDDLRGLVHGEDERRTTVALFHRGRNVDCLRLSRHLKFASDGMTTLFERGNLHTDLSLAYEMPADMRTCCPHWRCGPCTDERITAEERMARRPLEDLELLRLHELTGHNLQSYASEFRVRRRLGPVEGSYRIRAQIRKEIGKYW